MYALVGFKASVHGHEIIQGRQSFLKQICDEFQCTLC